MCVYASFILRPKLVINWTKDDSHEKCISALKIKDDKDGVKRRFLRVECANGDIANFTVDETEEGELPVWYLDSENAYRAKCESLLKKINPIHAQRDTLDAAYKAQCAPLYAAYEEIEGYVKI